jgi:hypothetical protein
MPSSNPIERRRLEGDVRRVVGGDNEGRPGLTSSERTPTAGRYDQLTDEAGRAWRHLRAAFGSTEEPSRQRVLDVVRGERDGYLRGVLETLPFSWHVEHAYATRETATYGGADHLVVDQDVKIGKATRRAGDTLARSRRAFNALYAAEGGRLPTSRADIRVAERIAAGEITVQILGPCQDRP